MRRMGAADWIRYADPREWMGERRREGAADWIRYAVPKVPAEVSEKEVQTVEKVTA